MKFRAVSRVAPRPLGPDVLRLPALRGHDVEDVRRQQERVDGVADEAVLGVVVLGQITFLKTYHYS